MFYSLIIVHDHASCPILGTFDHPYYSVSRVSDCAVQHDNVKDVRDPYSDAYGRLQVQF